MSKALLLHKAHAIFWKVISRLRSIGSRRPGATHSLISACPSGPDDQGISRILAIEASMNRLLKGTTPPHRNTSTDRIRPLKSKFQSRWCLLALSLFSSAPTGWHVAFSVEAWSLPLGTEMISDPNFHLHTGRQRGLRAVKREHQTSDSCNNRSRTSSARH